MNFKKHVLILSAIAISSVSTTSEGPGGAGGPRESLRADALDLIGDKLKAASLRRAQAGMAYGLKAPPDIIPSIIEQSRIFMPELFRWNETDFEKTLEKRPELETKLRELLLEISRVIPSSSTLTTLRFEITDSDAIYVSVSTEPFECDCHQVDLCRSLKTKLLVKRKVKPKLTISNIEAKNIKICLAYLSSGLFTANPKINAAEVEATLSLATTFEKLARGEKVFEPTAKPTHLGSKRK